MFKVTNIGDDDISQFVDDPSGDVPLIDANLLWTPNTERWAFSPLVGQVAVEHRKVPAQDARYSQYAKSWGACTMWGSWSPHKRITEMLRIAQVMTAIDGLDPALVHQAFAVIPEYRQMMARSVPEWADEFAGEDQSG